MLSALKNFFAHAEGSTKGLLSPEELYRSILTSLGSGTVIGILMLLVQAILSHASTIFPNPTVASLATALAGLQVNQRRGDDLRNVLWQRTRALLEHLDKLGVATTNTSGFPLVELAVADPADLDAVGRQLFDRGIYVTLAPYPVVPRKEAGFRIQLTAAHTPEQIDRVLAIFAEVGEAFDLIRSPRQRASG